MIQGAHQVRDLIEAVPGSGLILIGFFAGRRPCFFVLGEPMQYKGR